MTIALAVLRTGADDPCPETEIAAIERRDDRLEVRLDDGQVLDFNVWEFFAAAAAGGVETDQLDEPQAA